MVSSSPGPLLASPSPVVLLIALVVGLVAGGLAFLGFHDLTTAVLVGGCTAGSSLALLHGLISPDRRPGDPR
jgi:hypothetical protein